MNTLTIREKAVNPKQIRSTLSGLHYLDWSSALWLAEHDAEVNLSLAGGNGSCRQSTHPTIHQTLAHRSRSSTRTAELVEGFPLLIPGWNATAKEGSPPQAPTVLPVERSTLCRVRSWLPWKNRSSTTRTLLDIHWFCCCVRKLHLPAGGVSYRCLRLTHSLFTRSSA